MRRHELVTAVLLSVTALFAVLALGSAPRWATCATAALAILAAVPQIPSRRAGAHISPLSWLIGLAAGFTALQLVPLPAAVVGVLAPAKLEIVRDNAAALGQAAPGFLSLSLDPPATSVELAKLAGYLAMAFAAMRIAASERGRLWIVRTVAVAGLITALLAIGHHLAGAEELFGVYRPRYATPRLLAPLLNDNHLAGFLAFTVPLAVALAAAARGPERVLWVIAATVCAGVTLLTASRGGAVSLALGGVLVAGFLVLSGRRGPRSGRARSGRSRSDRLDLSVAIPAGVVLVCAVVVVTTLTAGGVRREFTATTLDEVSDPGSKFGIWRAGAPLIDESLWTGVGRGAFEVAFTRYHHAGVKTYSHAENEYLQALIDWGLPAVAAMALVFLWLLLVALRRWRRGPLEAGATAAIVVIGAHNLVDFNLELPGVATAALVVLATLVAPSLQRVSGKRRTWLIALRSAGLACAGLTVALAGSSFGRSHHADGDALDAQVAAISEGPAAGRAARAARAIAAGRAAWERHPADYLIAGLTADAYLRGGDPRAVKVVNRAQFLNPRHAGLHVLTARILLRAGQQGQALIEFSLALQYTLEPGPVLAELVRLVPDPARAARGIPTARGRVPVMTNRLLTLGERAVALAYARRVIDENDNDIDSLMAISKLSLEAGEGRLARRAAERLHHRRGTAGDAVLYGKALRASGARDQARSVLVEAAARAREHGDLDADQLVELYTVLGDVQFELGQHADARTSLRKALDLAEPDQAAGLYRRMARIEDAAGNRDLADELRKRAGQLDSR